MCEAYKQKIEEMECRMELAGKPPLPPFTVTELRVYRRKIVIYAIHDGRVEVHASVIPRHATPHINFIFYYFLLLFFFQLVDGTYSHTSRTRTPNSFSFFPHFHFFKFIWFVFMCWSSACVRLAPYTSTVSMK